MTPTFLIRTWVCERNFVWNWSTYCFEQLPHQALSSKELGAKLSTEILKCHKEKTTLFEHLLSADFKLNIHISLHKSPVRQILLFSFNRLRNWYTGKINNLHNVTQPVNTKIQTQGFWLWKKYFSYTLMLPLSRIRCIFIKLYIHVSNFIRENTKGLWISSLEIIEKGIK